MLKDTQVDPIKKAAVEFVNCCLFGCKPMLVGIDSIIFQIP